MNSGTLRLFALLWLSCPESSGSNFIFGVQGLGALRYQLSLNPKPFSWRIWGLGRGNPKLQSGSIIGSMSMMVFVFAMPMFCNLPC